MNVLFNRCYFDCFVLFFMAPKTIRSTLNMIGMVGAVALLLVLAAMSFVKIMQSPPEIFLGLAMVALGFFAIRDVYRLPSKKDEKSIIARKAEGYSAFFVSWSALWWEMS